MNNCKIFQLKDGNAKTLIHANIIDIVSELDAYKTSQIYYLEKEEELHKLFTQNMDIFLGIEHFIDKYHFPPKQATYPYGEADAIGIDPNHRPIIIEYKLNQDDGIVSQILFYLHLFQKSQNNFKNLVKEQLGNRIVENI